jgi:type IV secretory pathway TrbD component
MAQRRVTLHRSGVRHSLFLGGDRELVLFSGLVAAVLIFSCFQTFTIIAGIGLWVSTLWVFRRIAKADPKMRFIYLRSLQYRRYYPARSTPFRDNRPLNLSAYK